MVDIWAVFIAVPASFRFIAKKQLSYIPLFGWAMSAGRFIFIDRQNPLAARRSMDEAARRIRAGQSVVIFPEGTRTRDGRLGPFKKGGFRLAIDSGRRHRPDRDQGIARADAAGRGADPRRHRDRRHRRADADRGPEDATIATR